MAEYKYSSSNSSSNVILPLRNNPNPPAAAAADFNQLLRDSLSLVKHIDSGGIPAIQRNVAQLEIASRKLARTQPGSINTIDTIDNISTLNSAQLFLSNKGLDIQRNKKLLRDLDFNQSYELLQQPQQQSQSSLNELDVDGYLYHQHELLLSIAIEESAALTVNTYRRQLNQRIQSDWNNSKKEILDSMGFKQQGKLALQQQQSLKSSSNKYQSQQQQQQQSIEDSSYSKVIIELNNNKREGKPYALANHYYNAALELESYYSDNSNNSSNSNTINQSSIGDIADIFDIIRYIINEQSIQQPIIENKYSTTVYQSNPILLQNELIIGSKLYCENLFLDYMKTEIAAKPQLARLNGKPIFSSILYAFMNLQLTILPQSILEPMLIENYPIWPLIFYSLRAGQYQTAIEIVNKAMNSGYSNELRLINECLSQYSQSAHSIQLNRNSWDRLTGEYNREILQFPQPNRLDPFKVACYQLIGRFQRIPAGLDLNQYIAETSEDYIWYKLNLIYQPIDQSELNNIPTAAFNQYQLSLQSLQEFILQRGPGTGTDQSVRPLLYFKLLLLTQQFEQAIHYLIKTPLFNAGIQFAICLNYYGLLNTIQSTESNELLIQTQSQSHLSQNPIKSYSINFNRILKQYIETGFQRNQIESAFHYALLLHSNNNNTNTNSINESAARDIITELILSSREYELLIGSIQNNSLIKNGLLYQYYSDWSVANTVIITAANKSESAGELLEAIELYTLAEQYQLVSEILINQLGKYCATPINQLERQQYIQLTARFISMQQQSTNNIKSPQKSATMINNNNNTVSTSNLHSLSLLLEFCQFFDLFQLGLSHSDDALIIINRLKLIPTNNNNTDNSIEFDRFIQTFQSLHTVVKSIIINKLASAVMEIYYNKYNSIKSQSQQQQHQQQYNNQQQQQNSNKYLIELKRRAKLLVNFLGLIDSSNSNNQLSISGSISGSTDINSKLVRLEALMS